MSLKAKSFSLKINVVNLFWVEFFEQNPVNCKKIKLFYFVRVPAPKVPPQNKLTKFIFEEKHLVFKLINKLL